MSEWSVQDWLIFIGAVTTFLTVTLVPAVLTIIREIKKATETNLADRATKTAETLQVLAPIATQVNDIHAGTGNGGVTVNVPPSQPPAA